LPAVDNSADRRLTGNLTGNETGNTLVDTGAQRGRAAARGGFLQTLVNSPGRGYLGRRRARSIASAASRISVGITWV
jgi:hypothetical protein